MRQREIEQLLHDEVTFGEVDAGCGDVVGNRLADDATGDTRLTDAARFSSRHQSVADQLVVRARRMGERGRDGSQQ